MQVQAITENDNHDFNAVAELFKLIKNFGVLYLALQLLKLNLEILNREFRFNAVQ
jgi:hypothetical protein